MNIPKLRFPEFKGEWKVYKIGDVFDLKQRPIEKPKENYKSIGIRSHFKGTFQRLDSDPLKNEMDTLYQVKENDLIVNITFAWEGAVAIVGKEDENGLVSHRFPTYEFNKTKITIDFFRFLYPTSRFKNELELISPGGAGRNRVLKKGDFLKIGFLFPTLSEQTRIASFFTVLDKKIAQIKQKKTLLDQYKKGVMQKLFCLNHDSHDDHDDHDFEKQDEKSGQSGKSPKSRFRLRFKDENGKGFAKWEKKKLRELCEIVGGGTPETNKEEYWNGDIQWFTPTEIKSDFVTKSIRKITELGLQKSSAKKLPIGTILLTTRATIGEAAIAMEECTTNQGFQSLIVKEGNNNIFLFNWIKENKHELVSRANGSTFPEISKSEIEKISLIIPSLPEQTKIANFLSAIDEKITRTENQILKTQEWKKGLLQRMFV